MKDWHQLDVDGKPVIAGNFETPPKYIVVFLHGLRGESLLDAEAQPMRDLLARYQVACICPQSPSPWWTDRVDPEFDGGTSSEVYLLASLLPWMRERWPSYRHFGLLGIGLGGQGALRLAFRHADLFPVVAAISPAIEYYQLYGQGSSLDEMYTSKEQCRQDTVPMHLHPSKQPPHVFYCCDPTDDHWFRGCDRLHEKMSALGAVHESDLTTTAGGHGWPYFNAMAERTLRFLASGLTVESRRLL